MNSISGRKLAKFEELIDAQIAKGRKLSISLRMRLKLNTARSLLLPKKKK